MGDWVNGSSELLSPAKRFYLRIADCTCDSSVKYLHYKEIIVKSHAQSKRVSEEKKNIYRFYFELHLELKKKHMELVPDGGLPTSQVFFCTFLIWNIITICKL